jgi:hypothetical protein
MAGCVYPESGPNVPDSPDFLIKLHKPVRIPDRIFPDLVIKLWKPDSGFCIFDPDPGKIRPGAGPLLSTQHKMSI